MARARRSSASAARTTTTTPSPPEPALVPRHPDMVELIRRHLRPRARFSSSSRRAPPAHPFVHDHASAVYGGDPAVVTRGFSPAKSLKTGKQVWYFYTKVKAKDGRGMSRVVHGGAATWHADKKKKPVHDRPSSGEVIGYIRHFSFLTRRRGGVRTGWRMTELSLGPDGQFHGQGHEEEVLVLCKVYRSRRPLAPCPSNGGKAPPPPGPPPAEEEGLGAPGDGIRWRGKGKRGCKAAEPPLEEGLASSGIGIQWKGKGKRGRKKATELTNGGGGGDIDGGGPVSVSATRNEATLMPQPKEEAKIEPKEEEVVFPKKAKIEPNEEEVVFPMKPKIEPKEEEVVFPMKPKIKPKEKEVVFHTWAGRGLRPV